MKAQSELAGDCKRQAEMTCPRRKGGVTKRDREIDRGLTMVRANVLGGSSSNPSNGSNACTHCQKGGYAFNDNGQVLREAEDTLHRFADQLETVLTDNIHNEVIIRPTAQQWTVCTP